MFDTDTDGVLTCEQVCPALSVLGIRRSGLNTLLKTNINFPSEEEIREQIKQVSEDYKNNSLEFNEFLKLVALDIKSDATKNQEELFAAFE